MAGTLEVLGAMLHSTVPGDISCALEGLLQAVKSYARELPQWVVSESFPVLLDILREPAVQEDRIMNQQLAANLMLELCKQDAAMQPLLNRTGLLLPALRAWCAIPTGSVAQRSIVEDGRAASCKLLSHEAAWAALTAPAHGATVASIVACITRSEHAEVCTKGLALQLRLVRENDRGIWLVGEAGGLDATAEALTRHGDGATSAASNVRSSALDLLMELLLPQHAPARTSHSISDASFASVAPGLLARRSQPIQQAQVIAWVDTPAMAEALPKLLALMAPPATLTASTTMSKHQEQAGRVMRLVLLLSEIAQLAPHHSTQHTPQQQQQRQTPEQGMAGRGAAPGADIHIGPGAAGPAEERVQVEGEMEGHSINHESPLRVALCRGPVIARVLDFVRMTASAVTETGQPDADAQELLCAALTTVQQLARWGSVAAGVNAREQLAVSAQAAMHKLIALLRHTNEDVALGALQLLNILGTLNDLSLSHFFSSGGVPALVDFVVRLVNSRGALLPAAHTVLQGPGTGSGAAEVAAASSLAAVQLMHALSRIASPLLSLAQNNAVPAVIVMAVAAEGCLPAGIGGAVRAGESRLTQNEEVAGLKVASDVNDTPQLSIPPDQASTRLLAAFNSTGVGSTARTYSSTYAQLHRMTAALISNIAAANNGSQVPQLCEAGVVGFLLSLTPHWDCQVVQAALTALGTIAAHEQGAAVLAAQDGSVSRLLALLDGAAGCHLVVSISVPAIEPSTTGSPGVQLTITVEHMVQGIPEQALALLRALCRAQGASFQVVHWHTAMAMLQVLREKLWGQQLEVSGSGSSSGGSTSTDGSVQTGTAVTQSTTPLSSPFDAEGVSLMALDTLLLLIHAAVHELTLADELAAPLLSAKSLTHSASGAHTLLQAAHAASLGHDTRIPHLSVLMEGRVPALESARMLLHSPSLAQCVPQLVGMLQQGTSSLMVHRAAAILGQLAAEPARAEQLVQCNGVQALAPLLESPSRSIAAQAAAALLRCLPCVQPELLLPALPSLVRQLRTLKADDAVSRLLLLRSLRLVDQLVYTAKGACAGLHEAGGVDALLLATCLPSRAMCMHATSALLQVVKTHPPSLDAFAAQGGLLVSAELALHPEEQISVMAGQMLELLGSSQGGDPQPLLHLLAIQRSAVLAAMRRTAQQQQQAAQPSTGQESNGLIHRQASDTAPAAVANLTRALQSRDSQEQAPARGNRPGLSQLQVPSFHAQSLERGTEAAAAADVSAFSSAAHQTHVGHGPAAAHQGIQHWGRQASIAYSGLFHAYGVGHVGEDALTTPRTPTIPLQISTSMRADSLTWLDGLLLGGGTAMPHRTQHWTEKCFRLDDEGVPHAFFCPITRDVMDDPVVAADGFSYERGAIEAWLQRRETSPKTNMRLPHRNLIPNVLLKAVIKEWGDAHEDPSEGRHIMPDIMQ